jgi:hypothetical protein
MITSTSFNIADGSRPIDDHDKRLALNPLPPARRRESRPDRKNLRNVSKSDRTLPRMPGIRPIDNVLFFTLLFTKTAIGQRVDKL